MIAPTKARGIIFYFSSFSIFTTTLHLSIAPIQRGVWGELMCSLTKVKWYPLAQIQSLTPSIPPSLGGGIEGVRGGLRGYTRGRNFTSAGEKQFFHDVVHLLGEKLGTVRFRK